MNKIANIRYLDVVIAHTVVALFSFVLLGNGAWSVFASLSLSYMLPYVVYAKWNYANSTGRLALSVAYISMAVFMLLNYWQSTVVLGSVQSPFLLHDAQSFYRLSHDLYNNSLSDSSPIVPYMGYPLFLSWWLAMGITDIAYPIVVNIGLTLIALVLLGRCVMWVIDEESTARHVSGYAMMLTAFIPGVLGMSTLLAKEPFVILALLLCVNALYAIRQRYKLPKYVLFFLSGLVILAACRATYIYIVCLFALAIWGYKWSRRDIVPTVMMVAAMCVMLYCGIRYSWWGDSSYISRYISENHHHRSFFSGESQLPLQRLIGDYDTYPLWQRVLLLPVCVGVQFMIPFPFMTAAPDHGMPISMTVYQRMSYLWYVAAIPMLGYYLFYWWRGKGAGTKFDFLAATSAAAYCIPAFMTAGSISRYAYCFVPFLSVMGGYVVHRVVLNRSERLPMLLFAVIYALLISVALLIGANPHWLLHE